MVQLQTAMKVWILYDDLYDRTMSVHATEAGAQAALDAYIEGEVVEKAKSWWATFGGQERFKTAITKDTLEEHIAAEQECARENTRIANEPVLP